MRSMKRAISRIRDDRVGGAGRVPDLRLPHAVADDFAATCALVFLTARAVAARFILRNLHARSRLAFRAQSEGLRGGAV